LLRYRSLWKGVIVLAKSYAGRLSWDGRKVDLNGQKRVRFLIRNELKSAGFVRKLGNIIEEPERIGEKELIERRIGGESEIAKLRLRGWEFERWAM
jgi:hypothetical protein